MSLPPGISFIARSLLNFLLPSAPVYLALAVVSTRLLDSSLPNWVSIIASFLLRLGYTLSKPWVDEYSNSKAARAHGAVLVPHVKENHITLVKSLLLDLKDGYTCGTLGKLSEKYQSPIYRISIGLDQAYVTTEPDHIKSVLATEFDAFEKGPDLRSQLGSLLGAGVFNVDGEMWKFHRSITRPFFTRDRVTDFDNFERHSQKALKRAKARLAEGYAIDFQDLVGRFTLDSATEFLFNHDFNSLDARLPYPICSSVSGKNQQPSPTDHPSNLFVQALTTSQELIARRATIGVTWPLFEFWKDEVAPHRRTLDQFVQPFLEKGLREKENRATDSQDYKGTLLDCLVDKTSDQNIIRDELVNLLVAGRDTTSSLLTFSLYMLIEHPDIEARLRQEILEKVGSERSPTMGDIRELRYLKAFLNEVLRLYAIVPANTRTSTKPVILSPPAGSDVPLYIPAGTRFGYLVLLMHRRTDLWGPDALEFDPDRFLDERLHKYLVPNPFIFCPFNAGPRICPGQQFAYTEASFFLIRLLQQFTSFSLEEDARSPDGVPKPEWAGIKGPIGRDRIRFKNTLTMYAKGGLWVRMKEVVT